MKKLLLTGTKARSNGSRSRSWPRPGTSSPAASSKRDAHGTMPHGYSLGCRLPSRNGSRQNRPLFARVSLRYLKVPLPYCEGLQTAATPLPMRILSQATALAVRGISVAPRAFNAQAGTRCTPTAPPNHCRAAARCESPRVTDRASAPIGLDCLGVTQCRPAPHAAARTYRDGTSTTGPMTRSGGNPLASAPHQATPNVRRPATCAALVIGVNCAARSATV
jgi:hypothetical protein